VIPKQLQKEEFRFILLRPKEKIPIEQEWQETNNYKYDDEKLLKHLNNGGNYGVLCGKGYLTVLDGDKEELWKRAIEILPKTFTVKTGRGGRHFYFICTELEKPIRLTNETIGDIGDVQFHKKQVVGPNSTHPAGPKYEVIIDEPIATITKEQLMVCVHPWLKKEDQPKEHKTKYDKDLQITDVANLSKMQKQGAEYYGVHPTHGSDTGMNFRINPNKNVWHCFRHGTGGGPFSLLAVQEGIIDCADAGPGCLRGEKFKQVLKIAEEQFGIDTGQFNIEGKNEEQILSDLYNKIQYTTNFENIVSYIVKDLGIYYDEFKLWWLWDKNKMKWIKTDDVDVLNVIDSAIQFEKSTLESKVKNLILEGLKREGRKQKPKALPRYSIQFKDKIVNYMTGDEIPATKEYFATNPIPWDIGDSTKTPHMDNLIEQWVGKEYIKRMYQIIAFSIEPQYFIDKIFCYVGIGANGKSTWQELIDTFVGDENICVVDFDQIAMGNRFETSMMYKKIVARMSETSYNTISKTNLLKQLSTGKDKIKIEYKGKDGFKDYNSAKLHISTNGVPKSNDNSDGWYRRWLITKFPNKFEEGQNPVDLIPEEEYKNLARKCMVLLKELRKTHKFDKQPNINEQRAEYESYSNPIKKFVEMFYEMDTDGYVPRYEFAEKFENYLKQHNLRGFSPIEIKACLKDMNLEIDKRHIIKNDGKRTTWNVISGIREKMPLEKDYTVETQVDTVDTKDTVNPTRFLHGKLNENSVSTVSSVSNPQNFVLIDADFKDLPKRTCVKCSIFGKVVGQRLNDKGIVDFVCEGCFEKLSKQ
jgi:P4 family phage/plasmid primase-like protien